MGRRPDSLGATILSLKKWNGFTPHSVKIRVRIRSMAPTKTIGILRVAFFAATLAGLDQALCSRVPAALVNAST
jgi:hypothetical protein